MRSSSCLVNNTAMSVIGRFLASSATEICCKNTAFHCSSVRLSGYLSSVTLPEWLCRKAITLSGAIST